ncbi:MAG: diaminopimelate decarboxylase [Eubacteriales bacterium]|nr:diaminopimelate decarboxylase [Eubacteriales bacterium]
MLYDDLTVNEAGHLFINGADSLDLAKEFGTPLYVMDEDKLRSNCRTYVNAMNKYFTKGSRPLFAGKSLCFKGIYRIIDEEGMSADCVSPGEIYTAIQGGFPAEKIYFHGDNKTDDDIKFALDNKVGYFIVDNYNELNTLDAMAGARGIKQKVLLRVTVGIDPHTQKAINTGRIDCQFGVPIDTGQASDFVKACLAKKNLDLRGFHSHIGSEIFEPYPFMMQIDLLMKFANDMRGAYGFTAETLNLGGGFAVRYTESDPEIDIEGNIRELSEHLQRKSEEYDFPVPQILLEPGRSIVANAGTTLYTAGGVKEINGYRNYITVDGGMTDNPRYALYESPYTVVAAGRMNDACDFRCTIAGRCCESGDLIQENIMLPKAERGDIIAVLGTGAYNFAMSSNYNRVTRPALVFVKDGKGRLAVRRQTFEDLVACDL